MIGALSRAPGGPAGGASITATRRRALGTAALGGGATLLAACGVGGGGAPGGSPKVDLTGVSVDFWSDGVSTHPTSQATAAVLDAYTAQNTLGVRVNTAASVGLEAGITKVITALAAGTPPDLINMKHFFLADLFSRGATVDVDAELKGDAEWKKVRADAYPNIVQGLTWKGKLYAIPSHNSYFLMYYQPELLKRAGLAAPPRDWTWDRFVDYCRRASSPPDVTGYDCSWEHPRTGMVALNNGAQSISPDGTKLIVNGPEIREAIEWQLGLVRSGLMRPHNGSANGGYSEKLPQGTVAFQFGVQARIPTYRKDGVQFGTCFYPLGPGNKAKKNMTHGTAYGFAVMKNKDPKKQAAALQASLWAAKPESGMVLLRDGGVLPSYKSIVEAPSFQAEWKKDADNWPFVEALAGFQPFPGFPTFEEARNAVLKHWQNIWAGRTSVNDGLNEGQREAQQIIDRGMQG